MKLVGYIRVSTAGQVDDGYGLDVQREAIRAWARTSGHRLVEVFTEEGVSGKLEDRPALGKALRAIRDRRAAGMVVPKLDRLARDLVVQEQLIAEVWRMHAEIFSAVAGEAGYLVDDPDDPSRKLIRQVLGAVNEYERAMIALRLRSGRKMKADRGGYAYGAPPYGTRPVDRELAPDEREQAAVARMLELDAAGRSLREICAALAEEGHRPRRSGRWHPNTVNRVIGRVRSAA